jgi:class 3 adenylate cyclase
MAAGTIAPLSGGRLATVRLAYVGVLLLAVATFVHAVPHWVNAALLKAPPNGAQQLPSPTLVRVDTAAALAVPLAVAVVAAVILRYRSRDWFGLFASVEALLFGLAIAGPWSSVPLSDPWSLPTRVAIKLALIAIVTLLYTFPTGRFVPHWSRWLLVIFAGWAVVSTVDTAVDPVVARGIWQLALVAFFFTGLGAQAYRFLSLASSAERRQTKWVFYGLALIIAAYALWSLIEFGTHNQALATVADIAVQLASIASVLLFGIAVIRFRLYDIDLVVNRTILYGSATVLLVIAFAGLSELSKRMIEAATGHSSDIMTIPLIVAAAVAFGPLQRRIRPIVDRLLPPRAILTLFFTDICDSTVRAVAMGDERWRETLTAYRATVRRGLRRFKGSEMDTAGDGFFAVFDRPGEALASAEWIRDRLHELSLDSRFGLHAGECELRGEKVSGVAVIAAARVMATAGPNEIVISRVVHESLGNPVGAFRDLGEKALKGLPGTWQLYGSAPAQQPS